MAAKCLPKKSFNYPVQTIDDGLVTKFYMAMFGLIKWEGQYLEMGFDELNQACKILNLDSMSNKKRKNFIRNFYKIASTSVGRTLLYRLLIEIRRTNIEGSGCIDSSIGKILEEQGEKACDY